MNEQYRTGLIRTGNSFAELKLRVLVDENGPCILTLAGEEFELIYLKEGFVFGFLEIYGDVSIYRILETDLLVYL